MIQKNKIKIQPRGFPLKKVMALFSFIIFALMIIPPYNLVKGATLTGKTGQFSFNNGAIINEINNKAYPLTTGNSFSSGWLGAGLNENGGVTSVPMSDLGFDSSSNQATLSFWYKWDGSDVIMPVRFGRMNVFLYNNTFGVNTGNSDVFGLNFNPFTKDKYTHVTMVFTQGNASATKIYINGAIQIVSQVKATPLNGNISITNGNLDIGGASGYTPHGSVIDEIGVYNRALTDDEILSIYDQEKTNSVTLDSGRVGHFTFNGSKIQNLVNGKTYSENGNDYMDAMNDKGLRLIYNKSVKIPSSDLGFNDSSNYLTIAFWFKWDGYDSEMPIHFCNCDLYIQGTSYFGLNTGNGEVYGISNPFTTQGYYHVVAQLVKGNVAATKLYIDGTKQSASYVSGSSSTPGYPNFGNYVSFNAPYGTGAYSSYNSVIDEVSIYNRQLSDVEVQQLYNSEKTPLPKLNVATAHNGIKLDWSSEIAPEDTIWMTGFESTNDDFPPSYWTNSTDGGFRWGNPNTGIISLGNQSITTINPISGHNSYQVSDTFTNGNHQNNQTPAYDNSVMFFGRKPFPKDAHLSVQYIAKNTASTGYISTTGEGDWGASFVYHNVKLTKTAAIGDTVLHVDTIENYNYYGSSSNCYITSDTVAGKVINMYQIKSVDAVNKTITLYRGLNVAMDQGQQVNSRPWRVGFASAYIPIGSADGTKRFSNNMSTYEFTDYDPSTQGLSFYMATQTSGTINMDNVKLGYASRGKVYKDGNLMYDGYLSEYTDTNADKTPPNPMTTPTVTVQGQKINVSWNAVTDIGETHNYTIQGISRQAGSSSISKPVSASYTAGLAGYSYKINQIPDTDPGDTVNTTATNISQNLSPGTYYLHIKAIDNAGNVTASVHKQFTVLLNTATITPTANNNNSIDSLWKSSDLSQNYKYTVSRRTTGTSDFTNIISDTTTTTLNDSQASDYAAPDKVNNIQLCNDVTGRKIKWSIPSDNGTSYDYKVTATGQIDNVSETSQVASASVTTGIKGYYYTIDTNDKGNSVSTFTDSNFIDISSLVPGIYYLHIKAIDNAYNESSLVTQKFLIPSNTTYIDGVDVSTGTLDIYTYKTFKASVVTDGGYATTKFPFAVTDGTSSYAANTDIPLNAESSSGCNNTFSKIFKITSAVANGTVTSDSSMAYAVNNLSPETAKKDFNLKVHSLIIDGLKVISIVKAPQPTTMPQNCPVNTPINIKTGYNVTMQVIAEGQDQIDLSFYSGGNPVKIISHSNLNNNTERLKSSSLTTDFTMYFDALPENSIIDAKATAYDTDSSAYVIDSFSGTRVFKITGSYLDDSYINLIR